jgi:branched-chain amino acid transport system ATP-binding protein
MLQVRNLKKHFGGIKAVDGATFEVEEGKITALIGPNGAGKSTVFNFISGVVDSDEGEILFQGEDITNKRPEQISNLGISRLFQKNKLFKNLTVEENLLLAFDNEDTKFWKNLFGGSKKTSEKEVRIKEILTMLDMPDFFQRPTRALSYGQRRLIEIGRSIINPHSFLMLDEPVAGVNPKLRNKISELLQGLRKDEETILLIEHDMQFTLSIADWVIVMEKGRVIAEGTPEEIRENQQVLEAYLGE